MIKRFLVFCAALAAASGGLWWLLSLPSAQWYAAHDEGFLHTELVLVWIGAVAQTAFVLLWMTMPWFRSGWLTRAIMNKSFGIALLLDTSLVNYYVGPYPAATALALIVVAIVTSGSVTQLLALTWETWVSPRDRVLPGDEPD